MMGGSNSLRPSDALAAPDPLALAESCLAAYLARSCLGDAERAAARSLLVKLQRRSIEIVAFGRVSQGKTALLNALLGRSQGKTSPLHGTTPTAIASAFSPDPALPVAVAAVRPSEKIELRLVDTPGLDEIAGADRADLALAIARHADLILFVTAGQLTRPEKEALAILRKARKPLLLVFNKSDVYPPRDRANPHADLNDPELQQWIAPEDIVFTSAEPLPARVVLRHDRDREVWEPMPPQIDELKQRLLDVLNRDGKFLLASNVLESLAELQAERLERYLTSLPAPRTMAAAAFASAALLVVLSPLPWLDGTIVAGIASVLLLWRSWRQTLEQRWAWVWLVLGHGAIAAGLGYDNVAYRQILFLGASFPALLHWLDGALYRSCGWGCGGAQAAIARLSAGGTAVEQFRPQSTEGLRAKP